MSGLCTACWKATGQSDLRLLTTTSECENAECPHRAYWNAVSVQNARVEAMIR